MAATSNPLDALLIIRNEDGVPTARWNFPDAVGTSISAPGGIGKAVQLTYSFLASTPSYAVDDGYGFQSFDLLQQGATRAVLASIAEVARIQFIEGVGVGQITFGNSVQPWGQAAYAYPPAYGYAWSGSTITSVSESDTAGDVWFNSNNDLSVGDWAPGGSGFFTLLHEMGHALGLKHPFEGSWTLDPAYDDASYTVMSYTDAPNATLVEVSGSASSYSWQTFALHPSTLMPLDVVALQHLYGANTAVRRGNDVYTWGTNEELLETLWDGGGVDTIDCSNQIFRCVVNLEDYTYSSIGLRQTDAEKRLGLDLPSWFLEELPADVYDGSYNLAIARGVVIENATGGLGHDDLYGNDFGNRLHGGGGNDSLFGRGGNDLLVGGAGADTMDGGTGRDTYHVDDAGDLVVEAAGAGNDTVYSYLSSHTLAANVENGRIMLAGSADLAGNGMNNTLVAGAGSNVLAGGAGTDTLSYALATAGVTVRLGSTAAQATGGSGTDTLSGFENLVGSAHGDRLFGTAGNNVLAGGAGNDTIDGGAGNDRMVGGAGKDLYYVRQAQDAVVESVGGGVDTVYSYLTSHTLAANVENGRILAGGDADLHGNGLANLIHAGKGNNVLSAGAGVDTLSYAYGVTGSTGVTVSLASTAAQATGGSGTDTLGGFENLVGSANGDRLTGNTANNVLTGGAGSDFLLGGGGNDLLVGGLGRDNLHGGAGNDRFDFNALAEMGLTLSTCDIIRDFSRGQDRVDLATLDASATATGNQAFSWIGSEGFSKIDATGQLRFVYDSTRACVLLYGSTDADDAAEFMVQMLGLSTLAATDLIL